MGNQSASPLFTVTEEQVQQLLKETQLDRNTLVSLAAVFSAAPSVGGKGKINSGALPAATTNKLVPEKNFFPKRRVSGVREGVREGVGEEEMPLERFAKLLSEANICHGSVAIRMAELFDVDNSQTVSLREFLISMGILLRGDAATKLAFVFKTYDLDRSGTLTMNEVELLAAQMMSTYHSKGISLQGIEADQIVMGFLKNLDANGDGVITEEEFVTEGLKNPKLLPLLVNHNWALGEDFAEQQAFKFRQAAQTGKLDRVRLLLKEVPVDALGDTGETALFLAAGKHAPVVQLLLEAGANPNASDFHGRTPMHKAARSGCVEVLDLLHRAKADVNVRSALDGWTAFHFAVAGAGLPVVKHLLKLGADPQARTSSGMSALHVAAAYDQPTVVPLLASAFECELDVNEGAEGDGGLTPLHYASHECHVAVMRVLLDVKGVVVDAEDAHGATPLMLLCARTEPHPQLEECGKLLLSRRADATRKSTGSGQTALHLAALANNVAMCHLLAQSNRELLSARNAEGKTAMQVAGREALQSLQRDFVSELPDNTRRLIEAARQNDVTRLREAAARGGDPNCDDGAGNTPLYFALINKSVEVTVALLQVGARADMRTERGSPLHAAVMTGLVPLVTALLDKGASAGEADQQWGMQAIHAAAFFGKPEVIRLLVARKCSAVDDRSAGGKTPLHWAAQRGQVESAQVLLELGAAVDALNDDGLTPLHAAAAHGRAAVVTLLLAAGASASATTRDGLTLLHFAMQESDVTTIGVVLRAAPDALCARSAAGDTPLHRLCMGGTADAIPLFAEQAATLLGAGNALGQTPLHLACRHGNLQFVAALLGLVAPEGLNVSPEDRDGVTPLYYAAAARKEDIVVLLKSRGALFREEREGATEAARFEASPGFPRLQGATVEGLVDYLVLTCDRIDDGAFRDAFFLSYRQLIKPAELLAMLGKRLREASASGCASGVSFGAIRDSQQASPVPDPAAGRDLSKGRRQSIVKRVGLKQSVARAVPAPAPAPSPAANSRCVLIPENPLRQAPVLRTLRRWVLHSPMDFMLHAAVRGGSSGSKSARREVGSHTKGKLARDATFVLPRFAPMLRGTSPEENSSELQALVAEADELVTGEDEDAVAELALLKRALNPTRELEAPSKPAASASGGTSLTSSQSGAVPVIRLSGLRPLGGSQSGQPAKQRASFLDWTPGEAAQQLTVMSKHLWDSLSLWEFYDVAFTKDKKDELCPNINALIRHINRVGDWCKSLVLGYDDPKKRAAAISFVISVMDECLTLRNFSDVMGISTALQATPIERLSKSWRFVSEESMATLQRIKSVVDPRKNYLNLRKLTEERQNEPTIVFVGLIMGDLIHADEVTKMIDNRHNWYRYELLGRLLSVVPRYQKLQYAFAEEKAFTSMFDKCDTLDQEQVRLRSRELEPPEAQ